jgi:hemerythrin
MGRYSRFRLAPRRAFIGEEMKDLEWKDEYLLGIPELDMQHQRIFDCFVATAEEGPTKQDRWLADSSIVQLVGLLQQHFVLEESLMRIIGYPGLERHMEEHRQFNAELHDLAQKSLRTKGSVSREMIKAFQKWLREHIMASDRHYADYFSDLDFTPTGRAKRARNDSDARLCASC